MRYLLAVSLGVCAATSAVGQSAEVAAAFARIPIPTDVGPEKTVLIVSGKIAAMDPVALDLDTLQKMPLVKFGDLDPWDSAQHEFGGVELLPLLRRLGMDEGAGFVEVAARNGYKVSIRIQDLKANGYVLAYLLDGKLLRDQPEVKRRGTLLVALDFGRHPALDVEVFKYQLVWQVTSIAVR